MSFQHSVLIVLKNGPSIPNLLQLFFFLIMKWYCTLSNTASFDIVKRSLGDSD